MNDESKAGRAEATKLAVMLMLDGLTLEQFMKMPFEDQIGTAKDNLGIDPPGLIAAFRYVGEIQTARADAFREWNDARKSQ